MLDPVVSIIEVPCSQRMAFDVFVNDMNTWWPLSNFSVSAIAGKTAKSLRVEAKQGGKIVEIGHDDTEHLWGTIKSYDPPAIDAIDCKASRASATAWANPPPCHLPSGTLHFPLYRTWRSPAHRS